MKPTAATGAVAIALGLVITSCGDDCHGIASCVYQTAIVLSVSNAPAGGPVERLSVQVTGPAYGPVTCTVGTTATTCTVPGDGGLYTLTLEAPGFAGVQRSVTVRSTAVECECSLVMTQNVSLSMSRLE